MGNLEYNEALKLGQAEVRARQSRKENPYLPAFDDLYPEKENIRGLYLGTRHIPVEFIVGTRTRGRTESFAANFMPLLGPDTEFGAKWKALCAAHLEEGIREPVKVYEYKNRYYVEEGNKRVSVLKYFDAVEILALVYRIMPERTPENEAYFEYLAFRKLTGVSFVDFSDKDSFSELQRLVGKHPGEPWTEEDRHEFSVRYYRFRSAYAERSGGRADAGVGDAFLTYIRIFGYDSLKNADTPDIRKEMKRVREEMELQKTETPIEFCTDPTNDSKNTLLPRILPAKPLKVAFLHDSNPVNSGWTLRHELGRERVQELFGGRIETASYMEVMQNDPEAVLSEVVSGGVDVVFTTSPRLLTPTLRAAVKYPQTIFFNCSLNTTHRFIRTYYARMFEVKFIIGAVAGAMSETGELGYICDYPIFGQIAGINAFALGAQMVNPRAKVHLEWSSVGGTVAAEKRLRDRGITLISSQDIGRLSEGGQASFGLSKFMPDRAVTLATPVWNWGVYYEDILNRILDKSMQKEYESSKKALNYYWGLSSGVVGVDYSDLVPESVRKLAFNLENGVRSGMLQPFLGPLHRQDGSVIGSEFGTLSVEEIIAMDYLVDNVEGTIPAYEELSEIGKRTVDSVGVQAAKLHVQTEESGN